MAKYVYPAVVTPQQDGYTIQFPNLQNCSLSAKTLVNGLNQAEDMLSQALYTIEKDGAPLPHASNIKEVEAQGDAFVTLIPCDTMKYWKLYV